MTRAPGRRAVALVLALATACSPASTHQETPPMFKSPEVVREFVERIGLDALPAGEPERGVLAPWEALPEHLAAHVGAMEVVAGAPRVLLPGLATRAWTWRRGDEEVSVAVWVSGAGPQPARDQLLELATVNMMASIPYEAGPADLGELSIRDDPSSPRTVVWVDRNVCARVANAGTRVALEPIARAVQGFLAERVVDDLRPSVPAARLVASAEQIAVGDTVTVSVEGLEGDADAAYVGPEVVEQRPWLLTPLGASGGAFTFSADAPGRALLELHVADARTLLAPVQRVGVQVRQR